MQYKRNQTRKLSLGDLQIGGQDNVIIQSMTNTKTADIEATINQIIAMKKFGCDLVRLAVFDYDDANALSKLVKLSPLPIIADLHFNFEFAIMAIKAGVKKIRLNPGNIEDEEKIAIICKLANENNVLIRVGVNSGSLPKWAIQKYGHNYHAIVQSALQYISILNKHNFFNIVVSLKSSDPIETIQAYNEFSSISKYPLHLGVTEAGVLLDGTIKSTIGLTPLLINGIGDTIRISITDDPIKEVQIARKLLNYLKIRNDLVEIVSCPTCGRLNYNMFPLVKKIEKYTNEMFFPLKISILGCSVNGIGEGMHADIGVAGGMKNGIIFHHGKIIKTVPEKDVFKEIKKLIDIEYKKYLNTK